MRTKASEYPSTGEQLQDYLALHILMQGVDKCIASGEPIQHLSTPPLLKDQNGEVFETHDFTRHDFVDFLGRKRSIILAQPDATSLTESTPKYLAWISDVHSGMVDSDSRATAVYVEQKNDTEKFYVTTPNGLHIYNDRFMYDHQGQAVEAYAQTRLIDDENHHTPASHVAVFATGTGKSYIVANALKATGGEGIVVTPTGLGEQMLKDIQEVISPSDRPSRLLSSFEHNGKLDTKALESFKGTIIVEASDLPAATKEGGWLAKSPPRHILIDEAHEFTVKTGNLSSQKGTEILRSLAKHHNVLAVTATPTDELYNALHIASKKPIIDMTMHHALHKLEQRPFRPIAAEMRQIGTEFLGNRSPDNLTSGERTVINNEASAKMRREAIIGYLGRDEYLEPDQYLSTKDIWTNRADTSERVQIPDTSSATMILPFKDANPRGESIVNALRHNRVRFAEHKNIAFTVRGELAQHLASDLQAIHDGTYDSQALHEITQEVWKRRAQSAIASYLRLSMHASCLPTDLEESVKDKGLGILLEDTSALTDAEKQKSYREAIRNINPDDFKEKLPTLFKDLIKTPEDINLTHETQTALKETSTHAAWRREAVKHGISSKEARRLDLQGKLIDKLQHEGIQVDSIKIDEPSYYALSVIGDIKGKETVHGKDGEIIKDLTADDVANMVREGRVMHVTNNYRFTTGFSDPDVMMTQRLIENVGPHVIRATQIIGRPIREKDGIGAIDEIVGPCINLDGESGINKHFTCYDVIASDFTHRAQKFMTNWKEVGQENWKPASFVQGNYSIHYSHNGQTIPPSLPETGSVQR